MDDLPTWDQLCDLIRQPKPPLTCTVVEIRDGHDVRTARVVFDGAQGWWIDDGERVELRVGPGRATFAQDGNIERVDHDGVYSNGWVKSTIEGGLMAYLDQAAGDVRSADTVEGRPCWMADVSGLKVGVDEPFRLAVDQQTGVILLNQGNGTELQVRDLFLGTIEATS